MVVLWRLPRGFGRISLYALKLECFAICAATLCMLTQMRITVPVQTVFLVTQVLCVYLSALGFIPYLVF